MNLIVSILVIAGLLFGGGATVNAAHNDLPNEPLYGLKLWSEDLGVRFQNNPEQRVERLMDAQVRFQEMQRLTDSNQTVPDQVRQRLQDHIQQAFQACATMDDPALDRTLLQVRDRLQQQDRDMEQLQLHAAQNEQPVLLQTRTMLQQRLQLADEGLLNHEMFRYAVRNGFRFGQRKQPPRPCRTRMDSRLLYLPAPTPTRVDTASATFRQVYRSDRLSSTATKTLKLAQQNGEWRIVGGTSK